jgi:hypothetical protein
LLLHLLLLLLLLRWPKRNGRLTLLPSLLGRKAVNTPATAGPVLPLPLLL